MNIGRDILSRQYQAEDFDALIEDLTAEVEARNYRVTRIYHIDNIHERRAAGIDATIGFKRYKIVEFCNLNSCSELISAALLSGVFMPVRFVVYQADDAADAHIAFLKPTAFAALFDSPALLRIAAQLEQDMTDVLEEMDY